MKSNLKRTANLCLFIGLLAVKANAQQNIFNLTVKEDRITAQDGQKYFNVKYSNSTNWEPFYATIRQFNYQEGYRYQLKVKRSKSQNDNGYVYALNKIVKQQPIGEFITLMVKENLTDCNGVAPQKCFLVKYPNSKDWEYFYGHIDGFDYKEGNTYTIKVLRTKRENAPADASAYQYKLIKILKQKQVKANETAQQSTNANYLGKFEWKLIQLNGINLTTIFPNLKFDFKNNTIAGHGGCNRYFGSFKITGNNISFSKVGSTMMYCGEASMKIEGEYHKLISDGSFSFDIADQTLNLYLNDKIVMMFARVANKK